MSDPWNTSQHSIIKVLHVHILGESGCIWISVASLHRETLTAEIA